MRIAIISTSFPEDAAADETGVQKRFRQFIKALKTLAELDVLFFVKPHVAIDQASVAETNRRLANAWGTRMSLRLCAQRGYIEPQNRFDEYIRTALRVSHLPPYAQTAGAPQVDAVRALLERKPDLVFVHHLSAMIPFLLSGSRHPKVVFDMSDVDHLAYSRALDELPDSRGKPLLRLRLPLIRRWERKAIGRSERIFVTSETDRSYLARTFRCGNVIVVPNATEIPPPGAPTDQPVLLFLGAMRYPPNAAAAGYLVQNIWPRIRAARPDAQLLIAGQHPERIPGFGTPAPGVDYLGFVEDLAGLYDRVAVVCSPILSGSGTRIKVIEAAAYGKPVVSTTVGAEGLTMQDGTHLLLRDDPVEFARACVELLADPTHAQRIGSAARALVAERYARPAVVEEIRRQLSEVVHPGVGGGSS